MASNTSYLHVYDAASDRYVVFMCRALIHKRLAVFVSDHGCKDNTLLCF
jgi:hypothetical protein